MPARRPLAALLLLLLALAAPGASGQDRAGEVEEVRNDVRGTPPQGATVPLAKGDALVIDHRVETGADSGARMLLGTDGNLALGSRTRIVLDQALIDRAGASRSRLSLLVGSLRLRLGDLFRGSFEIDTPTAVIGVKGTDVRVFVYPSGITVVTVLAGVVTVAGKAAAAGAVEVTAGQKSVVEPGRSPTPPQPADGPAAEGGVRLAACTSRAAAGGVACACGSFPGEAARALRLDGAPVELLAATDRAVYLQIPAGLPPGEHTVSGSPEASFAPEDRCRVEVLELALEAPRERRRGQRARLEITVTGTRDRVPVRLRNATPSIVRLQGGDEQVLLTSGGRDNSARIRGRVIGVGEGRYEAELVLEPCPCTAAIGDPATDPEITGGESKQLAYLRRSFQ